MAEPDRLQPRQSVTAVGAAQGDRQAADADGVAQDVGNMKIERHPDGKGSGVGGNRPQAAWIGV